MLPAFAKTLADNLQPKTNSFRAQKFDIVLISYRTISYDSKLFCVSPISQLLNQDK
jgi:hypothetical protein